MKAPNSRTAFAFLSRATALIVTLATFAAARADENYFGYTYGSETLPRGRWELYQWVTSRSGKGDGRYRALDLQTELEHGFTDRLQGSLYLNAIQHDISGVTDFDDRDEFRFNGLQASLKYALTSPYKGGWGSAVYLEPGYRRYSSNSGEREDIFFIEPKLILQRNFAEYTIVWAINVSGEFEREHNIEENEWESELELQLSTGVSYRIAPNWFVGVEALATSAFERMHLNELGEYAIFAGPNLHYADQQWWATLTVFPQLTGWPETHGHREFEHFEKLQVRLKIGINF